jgi:hypothetical protein
MRVDTGCVATAGARAPTAIRTTPVRRTVWRADYAVRFVAAAVLLRSAISDPERRDMRSVEVVVFYSQLPPILES